MGIVTQRQSQTDMDPVNPLDLHSEDKRRVAMRVAAQLLANAIRCDRGQRPQLLDDMDEPVRLFYLQTARDTIRKYDAVMQDLEPVTKGDLRVIAGGKAGQ